MVIMILSWAKHITYLRCLNGRARIMFRLGLGLLIATYLHVVDHQGSLRHRRDRRVVQETEDVRYLTQAHEQPAEEA